MNTNHHNFYKEFLNWWLVVINVVVWYFAVDTSLKHIPWTKKGNHPHGLNWKKEQINYNSSFLVYKFSQPKSSRTLIREEPFISKHTV